MACGVPTSRVSDRERLWGKEGMAKSWSRELTYILYDTSPIVVGFGMDAQSLIGPVITVEVVVVTLVVVTVVINTVVSGAGVTVDVFVVVVSVIVLVLKAKMCQHRSI